MDNVLKFPVSKSNRKTKKQEKKRKQRREAWKEEVTYSDHADKRATERKIGQNLIQKCIEIGKRKVKKGAIHYCLGGLRVVVCRKNKTIITVYNKADFAIAA